MTQGWCFGLGAPYPTALKDGTSKRGTFKLSREPMFKNGDQDTSTLVEQLRTCAGPGAPGCPWVMSRTLKKACETAQPKQDISRVDDTKMFRLSSFCARAHRLRATVVCTDDKRKAPVAEEVSRCVRGLRKVSASRNRPRGPLWSAAGTIVSWMESELVRAHLVSALRPPLSFRRLRSDVVKRFADSSTACVFIAAKGCRPTWRAASVGGKASDCVHKERKRSMC